VWRAKDFRDENWSLGRAPLGYDERQERIPFATQVRFGPNPATKPITTYFRHACVVEDASAIEAIHLRLLRDDGAVVYVNGEEVWRDNLPDGPMAFDTLSSGVVSTESERIYLTRTLSAQSLVSGTNVLAVEVHQSARNTPDMVFALEATAFLRRKSD
jgi:hypothetical protein